jgi:hypothetical protein
MPHPSFLTYAEVLEMAAVLDCSDTRFVDGVDTQRESRDGRHLVVDTFLGTPDGAPVVGYTGFGDFRRCSDLSDSVHDAQAFLEIRFCISSRPAIEQ